MLATTLTLSTLYVAVTAGVAATRRQAAGPAGSVRPTSARETGEIVRASAVLRAWDRRRAVAWSRGDPVALAHLYTPRSRTGARDVTELGRWRGRGFRVDGLRQQVSELEVGRHTAQILVLRVTDRTVGGIAVRGDRRTALPTSAWTTHRIRLRHADGRWLVDEVVAQPAR